MYEEVYFGVWALLADCVLSHVECLVSMIASAELTTHLIRHISGGTPKPSGLVGYYLTLLDMSPCLLTAPEAVSLKPAGGLIFATTGLRAPVSTIQRI